MNQKKFIEKLFEKRSTFYDPDQAEMILNLLDTVSSDIYSENQRFVLELIQNADDAALENENEIVLDFYADCLIMSHKGKPFDEADINAITLARKGTKEADVSTIGYKGIGFKSVFGKSKKVYIFSDGYNFRFDQDFIKNKFEGMKLPWQTIPIWTEEEELPDSTKTIVSNGYHVNIVVALKNAYEFQKEVNDLLCDGKILLFLRRITKISVSTEGVNLFTIEKNIINDQECFTEVSLLKNKEEISRWIVKTFEKIAIEQDIQVELQNDEKTPEKLKRSQTTEISFAAKIEKGRIKTLDKNESLIFAYLPTKVTEYKFPFIVNANFLTNASRETIHEDWFWNKWLFKLVAQKIFEWLALLTQSTYKNQILNLLPTRFVGATNKLMASFNESLELFGKSTPFVPNRLLHLKKPHEIIIDNIGLSEQDFVTREAIIEYINEKSRKNFSIDSFIFPPLESKEKLIAWGAFSFEFENLCDFFASDIFKKNHRKEENFRLIGFLFEYVNKIESNDKRSKYEEKLKTIAFIMDEEEELRTPDEIYFPIHQFIDDSLNDFSLHFINDEVLKDIEADHEIKQWLVQLGVSKPTDVVFIEKTIIGNSSFVTADNAINVGRYLFKSYKKNVLTELHLKELRNLKLLTQNGSLVETQALYLSDFYEPALKLESIIDEDKFVSDKYKDNEDLISEWKTFFLKIGVAENINPIRLERKRRHILNENFHIDEKYLSENSNVPYYSYTYDSYSLTIFPFMQKLQEYEISKIFWQFIFSKGYALDKLMEEAKGFWGFEGMWGRISGDSIPSYFEWTIKEKECIPATDKKVYKSTDVFINYKDIQEIGGHYIPILDCNSVPDENFQKLLNFKTKLEVNDYLQIIEGIENDFENKNNEKLTSANEKRLGMIYNALATLIPTLSETSKNFISEWSKSHKLFSSTGNFENINELNWVKISDFTHYNNLSSDIKLLAVPENCDSRTPEFYSLLELLGVRIIDEFIPDVKNKEKCIELKNKLLLILPYLTAIVERKKYSDYSAEFERLHEIIVKTDFFSASEIILSFKNQNETILAPSVFTYLNNNELLFKGNWKELTTLYALIPELAKLLGLDSVNEELMLLLFLSTKQIEQWLMEQGYDLTEIKNKPEFARIQEIVKLPVSEEGIEQSFSLVDNSDEESRISIHAEAKEKIFETLRLEGFTLPEELDINYTVVNGVINPKGVPIKIVVKSAKGGKLYFTPVEWLALTEANAQLFIVNRGNTVRNVTLDDLIANNEVFHMRFNTHLFAVETNLGVFAKFFKYFPNTHFIFNSPDTTSDFLQQFGLNERNPTYTELSADDVNLLK